MKNKICKYKALAFWLCSPEGGSHIDCSVGLSPSVTRGTLAKLSQPL